MGLAEFRPCLADGEHDNKLMLLAPGSQIDLTATCAAGESAILVL